MRVIIAPDSFKECLSATRVALAISEGFKRADWATELVSIPMADGGEGTVEALVTATAGKTINVPSVDALNRPIESFYGVLGDGKTAVIEMAAASGLELLAAQERNPLITSTFGTGLLLKAAMEDGFREIIIGIGGSATNDGGAGMAQALGFELHNQNGRSIGFGGGSLAGLFTIDHSNVHPLLSSVKITIACDVQNPLVGLSGASVVYGPQKGATPEMVGLLEQGMLHYSTILKQTFGVDFATMLGAGAAGGLGAGLMAFCNVQMKSGFDVVASFTDLESKIRCADLVVTGEGKIDGQTSQGKAVGRIAALGAKYQVPVIALAGIIGSDVGEIPGLFRAYEIGGGLISKKESLENAEALLAVKAEMVANEMRHFLF